MVGEHGLGRFGREKLDAWIALQDPGDGAGMVLFGMVGNEIVDKGHILQHGLENMEHGRLDRIDERSFIPAPDEIGVVARPVGKRD
jgi:hypothetical protein